MRLTQAQQARLKAIEDAAGRLSARRVFEDAKDHRSPLHALYNWNVKHAAEKWWLHQTRIIIASVNLKIIVNNVTVSRPYYVKDTTVKGDGYQSTIIMRQDKESSRESLIYTLEVAAGHLRRAYDLAQPLGLTKEIDALLAQIAGVKRIAGKAKAA